VTDKDPSYEFDIKSPRLVTFLREHIPKVASMYGENPFIGGKSLFLAYEELGKCLEVKKRRLEALEKGDFTKSDAITDTRDENEEEEKCGMYHQNSHPQALSTFCFV
jgi:hypothetical protein